jgi:hypothetical protein
MDRKYIQNEHIVDRYLAGELTVREARDFEKFCLEHPDFLSSLPIPVRLKARLSRRPLEESETGMFPAIPSSATRAALDANDDGFDADEEQEKWERSSSSSGGGVNRTVVLALGVALIAAIGGLIAYAMHANSLSDKLQKAQRELKVTEMQAPATKQAYRIRLSASKPGGPTLALGWMQPPQMLDLIVPVGEEPYGTYQITIDKADGTRVMQIHRIARDSNKELRFGLNSSAFGPGDYVLKFEGYTWKGQLQPAGWVVLGLE